MPLSIRSGAVTLAGRREVNDDCVSSDPEAGLHLIADGTGSRGGGHVASELACEIIRAELASKIASEAELERAIDAAVASAHESIRKKQSDPNLRGMATTLVVLATTGDRLHVAHVGDSRAYLMRKGKLIALTRDHNVANYLADHPELAPKIKRAGDTLMRALGLNPEPPEVDHRTIDLESGDLVLACSDGVSSFLQEWTMIGILGGNGSAEQLATTLANAAVAQGSMDNASAIVLSAKGSERRTAALGWVAFLEGPRQGQVIALEGAATIGNSKTCDIVVEDEASSEIRLTDASFMFKATSGSTFLNDLPIEEAVLMDGDVIRIGSTKMVFKCYRPY